MNLVRTVVLILALATLTACPPPRGRCPGPMLFTPAQPIASGISLSCAMPRLEFGGVVYSPTGGSPRARPIPKLIAQYAGYRMYAISGVPITEAVAVAPPGYAPSPASDDPIPWQVYVAPGVSDERRAQIIIAQAAARGSSAGSSLVANARLAGAVPPAPAVRT